MTEREPTERESTPEWIHRPAVITVEGLAATGKGDICGRLCETYGYDYLSVSAVGRGLAIGFAETGADPDDPEAVREYYESAVASIELEGMTTKIMIEGRDVTDDLFTQETSELSSGLLRYPEVPSRVSALITDQVRNGNVVLDGRLLSEVAPGAELQVLLITDFPERVRRRAAQLDTPPSVIEAHLQSRDKNEIAGGAGKAGYGSIIVDTTKLTGEQTLAAIVAAHNRRFENRLG